MLGSDLLEIGIGMVLVFLFVSLICSAAREALETIMRTRAMDLERGIRELLNDPKGKEFAQALFNHPLVFGLYGGKYDPKKLKDTLGVGGPGRGQKMSFWARRHLPSYIPSGQFAAAVLDLIVRDPAATGQPAGAAPLPLTFANLKNSVALIQNEQVKSAVLSAIDYAGNDIDKVKTSVETWFNGTMDRVSGWYKRRTQMILFAIGVIAAIILNVDAITIAQRLSVDETLRKALVAQAERVVAKGDSEVGCDLAGPATEDVKCLRKGLEGLGLPIGWSEGGPAPQLELLGCKDLSSCDLPGWSGPGWALRILIGWLIVAFGVMLGAPFWFDVLNKFMIVRSTVSPADKAKK